MTHTNKPGPIFAKLQEENVVELSEGAYARLWRVIRRLNPKIKDFLSEEQGLITLKFLRGENVFGVIPTAGGKSLIYQSVARLTDGITVVVSPLIALMKDQVRKHNDGLATYFNSDLSPIRKRIVRRRLREGKVRLLYISPERLKSAEFKELLDKSRRPVARFVIDEAHCVIEWGYGFRVKYLHIGKEIHERERRLPRNDKLPVLLLTATASSWLQKQTAANLRVDINAENYIVQRTGADRPELRLGLVRAQTDTDKIRWIAEQLKRRGRFYRQRGIIFSAFADGGEGVGAWSASKICEELRKRGVAGISCYHAGMSLDERGEVQRDFQHGKLRVLVATKAFGMGIDLPRLRFIFHFYPPLSLEEYWQEAGRGGRGMNPERGEKCVCTVLHGDGDYSRLAGFPNIASFAKTLSTFSTPTNRILCLDRQTIKPNGKLRKALEALHEDKCIRRLRPLKICGITLERWKLRRPASRVLYRLENLMDREGLKAKQTKRLRSNLRLCVLRRGNLIRVPQDGTKQKWFLGYYNTELNWLTEPEIGALDMIDDERRKDVVYSRFRILKETLTRKDMLILNRKINSSRNEGFAKLNHVFDRFLKSRKKRIRSVILRYLSPPH